MSTPQKVQVLYKYVDGAHFFVSDDKETAGLCVAHNDLRTAFHGVGDALTFLFKTNLDEDVKFVPELSFEAFQDWVTKMNNAALQGPTPGIAGQTPWAMSEAA